jgi:mannan endo-1,4-beta-mannosidase
LLDGVPYRFHGLNIYNANSNGSTCWYAMNSGTALSDSLAAIGPAANTFRAWFFQYEATTNGVRDWRGFDHTLAAARAAGVRVIPVLINQWGQCEGQLTYASGYKTEAWYQSGYSTGPTSPGMANSYRQWVAEVVARYKNDPTILAWQMVNEAEDKTAYAGSCSGTAAASLQSFAADIAGLIKSIDRNHLVSIGTMGSGQCGSSGSAYRTLHATAGVDLCEYHDYSPVAMPGDQWNGLATRISQCSALGKPLFVGESGIKTSSVSTLSDRASLFEQKFSAQFRAGVVGELPWDWRNAAHGGSSTTGYEVGPGDPMLGVLATYGR